MTEGLGQNLEQRLLILTPTGKDARLAASVLAHAHVTSFSCTTLEQLCGELGSGAAAVLMAEEAVVQGHPDCLGSWLAHQPPWSDLPVLILARSGADSASVAQAIAVFGNVTVMERPVRVAALVSAVRSALRARQRQYQIRAHLAELARSASALRDADRRKDEFIAMLGHELRNPLAPIYTSVEIMKRTNDAQTHRKAREVIERQVEQMVHLVDDLLDVSRIRQGKIILKTERLMLGEIVGLALESSHEIITDRKHRVHVVLPPEQVFLEGDKTRLCQVLLNLLTNAAKYTPAGGIIQLCATREGNEIVITIEDNGIGIPENMLGKVFDMFTRVERQYSYQQQGLGIGLSLVKQLVQLHKGTISVKSEGEGKGSTFIVRLPVVVAGAEQQGQGFLTDAPLQTSSKRVLVVDDHEANRETIARLLNILGHDVRMAASGEAGLAALNDFPADVVFLDLNMPGISGLETARRIREQVSFRHVTLVALTGYGQEADIQRTREAGFDGHLVKPVDVAALEQFVK